MAKLSKKSRIAKKQARRKQDIQQNFAIQKQTLQRKTGLKPKQVKAMSDKDVAILYKQIIQEQQKEAKRKQKEETRSRRRVKDRERKQRERDRLSYERSQKRLLLDKLGFPSVMEKKGNRNKISNKYIDSISMKDIQENRINRDRFPELFQIHEIDFNKRYYFPNGVKLFIAYRSMTGDETFSQHLAQFNRETNAQLIDDLDGILHQPLTYSRLNKGGSSGRAGEVRFTMGNQSIINAEQREIKHLDKTARIFNSHKKWQKEKIYQDFQSMSQNGNDFLTNATPRQILIMLNAVMYNIVEIDRQGFYYDFYDNICKYMPVMKNILPI